MARFDWKRIEEARREWFDLLSDRVTRPVEMIELNDALDRILASDVCAPIDIPNFTRSTVDGWAVRSQDTVGASVETPVKLQVAGRVEMGGLARVKVSKGEAVHVPTGGYIAEGADAVVLIEDTVEYQHGETGEQQTVEQATVSITDEASAGDFMIVRGEDVAAGDTVVPGGRRLRPPDIGALAGAGCLQVPVWTEPAVAIISTGQEVIPPELTPAPGEVRDTNRYMLAAAVRRAGGRPVFYGMIPDDPEALAASLAKAVDETDVVLICGGSSVGEDDVTREIIDAQGPPGVVLHGVRIKPGKPTVMALSGDKPVFGLPGNPVSSYIIFRVFVQPTLAQISGESDPVPGGTQTAVLTGELRSPRDRVHYHRVQITPDGEGNGWLAEPVYGKSGLLSSLASANGLVAVPIGTERIETGTRVEVMPLD